MGGLIQATKQNGKIIGLIFLMAISFCFAMFQGSFVSWFIFYTFLPFVLYSVLLFFYPLRAMEVRREVSQRECRAGDFVEVTLTITRRNRLPIIYMLVEEDWRKVQNEGFRKKMLVFPGFKKNITLSYTLGPISRGEYTVTAVTHRVRDLFGFYEKSAVSECQMTLTVFPAYRDLPFRQVDSLVSYGQTGLSKKNQREQSVVSGIRTYQPGDQLSWINWKATAKKSEIMTKEFEIQRKRDIWVVLDEHPSPYFEAACVMAASLVHTLIKKNLQAGFLSTGTRQPIPVGGGHHQRRQIFFRLAQAEPKKEMVWDEQALRGVFAGEAALLFVMTDLTLEKLEKWGPKHSKNLNIIWVKPHSDRTEEEKRLKHTALSRGILIKDLDRAISEPEVMAT